MNAPLAIFAHPGHELRILHALGQLGASCLYLTDASGSTGTSRIPLTTDILQKAGLPDRITFRHIRDGALYTALQSCDMRVFDRMRSDLDVVIRREMPDFLITDSAEGYNPAHDICHFLALHAGDHHGVRVYDIALDGDPGDFGHAEPADCIAFHLDPSELAGKLGLIAEYIQLAGDQLAEEAAYLLALYGKDAQADEILRPALSWAGYERTFSHEMPFFETHGRRRVREGKYATALTYRGHLRPVLAAIMAPA